MIGTLTYPFLVTVPGSAGQVVRVHSLNDAGQECVETIQGQAGPRRDMDNAREEGNRTDESMVYAP